MILLGSCHPREAADSVLVDCYHSDSTVAFVLHTEDTLRLEMADLNEFDGCSAPQDCAKRVEGADIEGALVALERGQAFGRHGHRKRLEFAETDLGYSVALRSPHLPRE